MSREVQEKTEKRQSEKSEKLGQNDVMEVEDGQTCKEEASTMSVVLEKSSKVLSQGRL